MEATSANEPLIGTAKSTTVAVAIWRLGQAGTDGATRWPGWQELQRTADRVRGPPLGLGLSKGLGSPGAYSSAETIMPSPTVPAAHTAVRRYLMPAQ